MEVTLKVFLFELLWVAGNVSILVLMEVTLKGSSSFSVIIPPYVSILVLMEVTLKVYRDIFPDTQLSGSFNPCFNGSDSKR